MMNKIISTSIAILFSCQGIAHAAGYTATLQETHGLVLINQGEMYVSAKAGQRLKAGDQVFTLAGARASVLADDGCNTEISANALLTVKSISPCASQQQAKIKHMGSQVAAAIGAIDLPAPTKNDAPAQAVIDPAPINEEPSLPDAILNSPEPQTEEMDATRADVQEPASPELVEVGQPSLMANLGSKLAIPAALTGAVVFSIAAGGLGGEGSGGDNPPDVSPQ